MSYRNEYPIFVLSKAKHRTRRPENTVPDPISLKTRTLTDALEIQYPMSEAIRPCLLSNVLNRVYPNPATTASLPPRQPTHPARPLGGFFRIIGKCVIYSHGTNGRNSRNKFDDKSKAMNLKETLSRFGIHFIEKWFRIMVLINCLSPVTAQCVAQSNSANFNRNVSRAISVSSFDSLVSHSIVLLETKELSQISDSDHIKIMMCLNTITFTIIKHSFKKRFTDEKYQRFIRLSEEKGYPWSLVNIYPKWFPNRGMGLYFPQLKMEVYGTPMPYAIFKGKVL